MNRPKIVTLCGSTRFFEAFTKANYDETMKGHIVLSVGFFMHTPQTIHGQELGCTPEQKVMLDELHLRKVEMADEVLILNCGGYIGESTRNELKHAQKLGKAIRYLEPDPSDHRLVGCGLMSELDLAEVEALRLIAEQRVAEGDKRSLHVDAVFLIALIARLRSCEKKLKAAEADGYRRGLEQARDECMKFNKSFHTATTQLDHDFSVQADNCFYMAQNFEAMLEQLPAETKEPTNAEH